MLSINNIKLAAPPSQRSNWSRFWAPSWTRRGKDKDAQYEMDNILESISNISNSAQQIRSNISHLRFIGNKIGNQNLTENIRSLSTQNWESVKNQVYSVDHMLNSLYQQDQNNAHIQEAVEYAEQLNRDISLIQRDISRTQRNMYNLRMRDAVKGTSVDEFGDLSQTLNKLYSNPLDEKTLYYAQKMHGRLEDSLNSKDTYHDEQFNQWIGQPNQQQEGETGFNMNRSTPSDQLQQQNQSSTEPNTNSPEDVTQSIANNLAKIISPESMKQLLDVLHQIMTSPIKPEEREKLNMLSDAINATTVNPSLPQSGIELEPDNTPKNTEHYIWDPQEFNQRLEDGTATQVEFPNEPKQAESINLKKIADNIALLDPEIANLLRKNNKKSNNFSQNKKKSSKSTEKKRVIDTNTTNKLDCCV